MMSKKKITLIGLLLSAAFPGFSQGRDTVLAVHKLFQERQGRSSSWMAGGAKVAVDESVGWRSIRSTSDNVATAAVHGGVPFLIGLTQAQRFSPEREQNIVEQYANGWSIPADIRRRLRRRHFHLKASDIQGVNKLSPR